jgi:branched-chain amino acid aminotransferase
MGLKIYLDGKLVDREQATVSVFDHGLLYGDGVFEGIRSYDGLIFKLEQHIDRLFESAHTIMLRVPMTKGQLIDVVKQSLRVNKLRDAYIRLVVTRGVGDLGLDPRKCAKPTVFVIAGKIELYPKKLYEQGLALITVATQRNVPEALNPQIKSLNYLNNILGKIEAINAGYEEAIMLSHSGYVTECTGENIFLVKGKRLLTPPPQKNFATMELKPKSSPQKQLFWTKYVKFKSIYTNPPFLYSLISLGFPDKKTFGTLCFLFFQSNTSGLV